VSDFREAIADRLERAADRMYNAGLLDEERSFRDAAARIRAGLSLEETRALEQQMLSGQSPRLLNRLTALAAQGEYDGGAGGIDGQGSTGSATADAVDDEPVLTLNESGASQLLSTAASTGLADQFSSAQNGWISGSQDVNWFTLVAAGIDNPNSFTTGQNINPWTGDENTESFTGGVASPQSPQPTGSAWAAFGYSGPPPSILASPDLLAQLDTPANPNVASDASGPADGVPGPSGNAASNASGPTFTGFATDYAGTNYATYSTSNGSTVWINPDTGAVSNPQLDVPVTPGAQPQYPPDFVFEDPNETPPVPTTTNTQSSGAPVAAPLTPQLTPAQEAQLNAAIQQAVGPPGPNPVDTSEPTNINDVISGSDPAPQTQNQPSDQAAPPAATPQPGSGSAAVPFNPMADSPFASWLLYGSNTPILDALTNDSNLQAAQNVALGVALGAATIATGGALLEAAPVIGDFAFETSIQVAARFPTATSIATGLGNALTYTTVPRVAVGLGVAGLGTAAVNELPALEQGLGNAATNLTEATGPSFEGLINPSEFEDNPVVIDRLSRAREFDIGGYQSLTGRGPFGRVGDNLDSDEALQNAFIRMAKDVERVSQVTQDNPAIALRPQLHQLIDNLRTADMQGLTPEQVLQYHLEQLREIVPEYIVNTLERESQQYIARTF
jgi:hypothetical protein